jgi:hypothetical protein
MLREPQVNYVPFSAGRSLQLMMTPPQNCRGWQRWIHHEGEEGASEGESSPSTDLVLPLLLMEPVVVAILALL